MIKSTVISMWIVICTNYTNRSERYHSFYCLMISHMSNDIFNSFPRLGIQENPFFSWSQKKNNMLQTHRTVIEFWTFKENSPKFICGYGWFMFSLISISLCWILITHTIYVIYISHIKYKCIWLHLYLHIHFPKTKFCYVQVWFT